MSTVTKTKARMYARANKRGKVAHKKSNVVLKEPSVHRETQEKVKCFFKSKEGQSSILFTDQLTHSECENLQKYIYRWLKRKHTSLSGTFVCVQKKRR